MERSEDIEFQILETYFTFVLRLLTVRRKLVGILQFRALNAHNRLEFAFHGSG